MEYIIGSIYYAIISFPQNIPVFSYLKIYRILFNYLYLFYSPAHNQSALSKMPGPTSVSMKATSIGEFMEAAAPLAGCQDVEHFYQENNPMQYFTGNQIPCLVLNALDDFLCLKENIRYDVKDIVHNYVLAITDHGSHIAYNEGCWGEGNYMWRLTLDFFDTVKED